MYIQKMLTIKILKLIKFLNWIFKIFGKNYITFECNFIIIKILILLNFLYQLLKIKNPIYDFFINVYSINDNYQNFKIK